MKTFQIIFDPRLFPKEAPPRLPAPPEPEDGEPFFSLRRSEHFMHEVILHVGISGKRQNNVTISTKTLDMTMFSRHLKHRIDLDSFTHLNTGYGMLYYYHKVIPEKVPRGEAVWVNLIATGNEYLWVGSWEKNLPKEYVLKYGTKSYFVPIVEDTGTPNPLVIPCAPLTLF